MSPYTNDNNSTNTPNQHKLTVSSVAEFQQIPFHSQLTTFVNCHLQAPICEESDRKPIDLVVILDRSGSMAGSKLNLCKSTMEFLMKELSVNDRLSLITYHTDVSVDMHLTKMTQPAKDTLLKKVYNIQAGSMTNLSGGILAGLDEIQKSRRDDGGEPNPVQSVLVLTDGMANVGITDSNGLVKLLEGALSPNVSLFTFGYGSDHNETLLREMSDLGRGVYYFVENIDGVSLAFADCLGGLLSVVAQNLYVECVALDGVNIKSIKTKRNTRDITSKKHIEIEMGDLYAEEVRDILVEIEIAPIQAEVSTQELVEFRVRYANILLSTLEKESTIVSIARPKDGEIAEAHSNVDILQQKSRVAAAEAIEEAQEEAKKGNLIGGQNILKNIISVISTNLSDMNLEQQEVMKPLLSDLDECKGTLTNTHDYNIRGRHRLNQCMQQHQAQRSNDFVMEKSAMANPTSYPAPVFAQANFLQRSSLATSPSYGPTSPAYCPTSSYAPGSQAFSPVYDTMSAPGKSAKKKYRSVHEFAAPQALVYPPVDNASSTSPPMASSASSESTFLPNAYRGSTKSRMLRKAAGYSAKQ